MSTKKTTRLQWVILNKIAIEGLNFKMVHYP